MSFRTTMRVLSVGFTLALTVLLLHRAPVSLLPFAAGLVRTLMPLVHFATFFVLTLLFVAARWPLPRHAAVLILLAYAVGTELLQSLFAPRTPELADAVQNLVGILAGLAVVGPLRAWFDRRPLPTTEEPVAFEAE